MTAVRVFDPAMCCSTGVLETKGVAGLPVVKVNGEVRSSGVYPSRAELAAWAGIGGPAPSLFTETVAVDEEMKSGSCC